MFHATFQRKDNKNCAYFAYQCNDQQNYIDPNILIILFVNYTGRAGDHESRGNKRRKSNRIHAYVEIVVSTFQNNHSTDHFTYDSYTSYPVSDINIMIQYIKQIDSKN